MEKKVLVIALSVIMVSLIVMTIGICIGETETQDQKKMQRANECLNRLCEISGYKNLGVVDAYRISQETGHLYNGRAVIARLFQQNNLDVPTNYWSWTIDHDYGDVGLYKLVVYKGEITEPIFDQEIQETYLYGLY